MKKKTIILLIGVVLICCLLFLNFGYSIKLIGEEKIELEVYSEFNDPGYILTRYGKNIGDTVEISSNVDTSKVGEYEVKYSFNKLLIRKDIIRKVVVKDTTSPVISLNGNSKITIKVGESYKDLGVSIIDNYDGDISENVTQEGTVDVNKVGSYEIIYKIVDSNGNKASAIRVVEVEEKYTGGYGTIIEGPTYINGILIVNKKYKLPSNFGGTDQTALSALRQLQSAAESAGYDMPLVSGYRSYETQKNIYNRYVSNWGIEYTDTTSARPGHSEHQTGLAFDVGELKSSFGDSKEGIWLKENCYKHGFIIRYLKGKEHITGYSYEPWHIRYVGVDAATYIMKNNLTLEEYLGV